MQYNVYQKHKTNIKLRGGILEAVYLQSEITPGYQSCASIQDGTSCFNGKH